MFRAVGNRCAVNLRKLNLPIPIELAKNILQSRGFELIQIDLIETAGSCIGKAKYKLGATQYQAPHIFDCSSFTKWVYAQSGIELKRRTIQQFEQGLPIPIQKIRAGDLIFKTGQRHNWYRHNPNKNVGHVGIATGKNTVIHAANHGRGVTESPISEFTIHNEYRGICRIITNPGDTETYITPPHREIECSDDFFWVIVQSLPKT
ncbi:MAG: NlpC/P60 family protein [Patescibacteria group bacterium]|nr:NlpC/P60 family protein [Patescibacteria group bacterium]